MKKYDAVIAGGGPAGSFLAHLLASEGYKVALVEYKNAENYMAAKACGSLSSEKVLDLLRIMGIDEKEVVDSRFKTVSILDGTLNDLSRVKLNLVHLDRYNLGREMLEILAADGVEVLTGYRADELIMKDDVVQGFKSSNGVVYRGRITIDTTGFGGTLRRQLASKLPDAYFEPDDIIVGAVSEINKVSFEFDEPTIILSNTLAPGGYCWVTPLEKNTLIGLGFPPSFDNVLLENRLLYLYRILKIRPLTLRKYYGVLPIRRPLASSVFNGFMVLGDAASHGNPLFEGGIYGALYAAKLADEIISNALTEKDDVLGINDLWTFNVRYMRERGWILGVLDVLRLFIQKFSQKNLYLFASALPEKMSFDLDTILHISLGLLTTILKPRIFWSLMEIAKHTIAIQDLYLRYPESPSEVFTWARKVENILKEVKKKKITI